MSTIFQQPDELSFSGNLKKFEITSDTEVVFELSKASPAGLTLILSEKYQPTADHHVTIDIKAVIDRLLEVTIPTNGDKVTEQTTAVGDYFARVDDVAIPLRIIKGGVFEMQEMAGSFLASHFLTWQNQEKRILQTAPEWLGIYPVEEGTIKLRAYYADLSFYEGDYATLSPDKLYSLNTSWGSVSAWLNSLSQNDQVIAWDVWFEVDGVRKTPVQQYQLRNANDQENIFVWANTLGGIDSVSFSGYNEEDQKLDHKTTLYYDDTIGEYDVDKKLEIRQSTGYLTIAEGRWVRDFFWSRKKYEVQPDGSLRQIAVVSSKVINVSSDDQYDYEFTYRYCEDAKLLNLDRTLDPLPVPEDFADIFLAQLLSGLTDATYRQNLLLAVQSPFTQGWQKLSFAQLWGAALPTLVDNTTTAFINGKLRAFGAGGAMDWEALKDYIDLLLSRIIIPDTRTELLSGAILWKYGLTFQSTRLLYKILGVRYIALPAEITLDPAHPTLSRMDTFYVDAFANLQVATGVPADEPTSPGLMSSQLAVMTVLIGPGATEPSGLTVTKIYDENNPGAEWSVSASQDSYVTVDFNSADQPLSGSRRIKVAISVPDTVRPAPIHYIGEPYDDGIIFQIDSTGKKGLIAAKEDIAMDVFWESLSGQSVYSTGASGIEIGTGEANTALMLASDAAKDYAVRYCNDFAINSGKKCYIPSVRELELMYFRKLEIGIFDEKTRWSSSENDWNEAWCISFSNGVAYPRLKNNRYCVRVIWAFDDTTLPVNQPVPTFAPSNTLMDFTTGEPVGINNGLLALEIKSSLGWQKNSAIVIDAFLKGERTGRVSISPEIDLFGYQPDNDAWQLVVVPLKNFSQGTNLLDGFRISLSGNWTNGIDLGIDNVRFQNNEIVPTQYKTYGSVTRHVAIQTTDQGEITAIKEIDVKLIDEELIGVVDGVNRIFATSKPHEPGTITLFRSGMKYRDFTEVPESDTLIELEEAPLSDGITDKIEATYLKKTILKF